jgi:hypothetical protein
VATAFKQARPSVRRGGAVADSDEGGRSGEDKSPLRDHARPSSSSRRVHPRLRPVVDGLQVMRGIALIKLVTEVGDFTRFSNPRQLMAYFGMVPGERSSGETTRHGGINKAGNTHARRALVDGAWAYRMKARIGRHKVEALPKVVRDIGWKAQVRLRSLAMHRLIAEKVRADPALLDKARENLRRWQKGEGSPSLTLVEWENILSGPVAQVAQFLEGVPRGRPACGSPAHLLAFSRTQSARPSMNRIQRNNDCACALSIGGRQ